MPETQNEAQATQEQEAQLQNASTTQRQEQVSQEQTIEQVNMPET